MRRFILQENVRRLQTLAAKAADEESRSHITSLLARAEDELAGGTNIWRRTCRFPIPEPIGHFIEDQLEELVDAQQAGFGSMQIYDPHRQTLCLVAQINFAPAFVSNFGVTPLQNGTVCSRAAMDRMTVTVADIQERANEFPGFAAYSAALGLRAVQSTPVLSQELGLLGVCSTHFLQTHQPTVGDGAAFERAVSRLRPVMERLLQ